MIGREGELVQVQALIERCRTAFGAAYIEGEPGTGKTTIWEAVLERVAAGTTVGMCRPVEAESGYSFGSLGDLLANLAHGVIDDLPPPQRHALRAALLMEPRDGRRHDHRAVGAATLSVLRTLASASPVIVAVDDLQWLDRPSARALAYALRRLTTEPVAFLATRRYEVTASVQMLDAALGGRDVIRVTLSHLSLGALTRVVDERLGVRFPRGTMARIHETCAGNPLHALELARALAEAGSIPGPGEPLPVPVDLQTLLLERIRKLPSETRQVLLIASLLAHPSEETLVKALGKGADVPIAGLRGSGVADVWDGAVRFSHPLLASAVVASASARERREAHRRLAGAVEDEEQHARHLAMAATGPDPVVAAALEAAAHRAVERGATDAAAELAELALTMTDGGRSADVHRLSMLAAETRWPAGDLELAGEHFDRAEATATSGAERARALVGKARVFGDRFDTARAADLLERALAAAPDGDAVRAVIERDLALLSLGRGDLRELVRHARNALDVAAADSVVVPDAAAALALGTLLTGGGLRPDLLAAARQVTSASLGESGSTMTSLVLSLLGEFDEARELLLATEREMLDQGNDGMLPFVRSRLAELDCWTGDWQRGLETALDADRLARENRADGIRLFTSYAVALLSAHLGRVDDARSYAESGVALSFATGARAFAGLGMAVIGFVESALGAHEKVVAIADPLVDLARAGGMEDPIALWGLPDHVEALVAVGRVEDAAARTDWLEDRSRAIDRARGLAAAARCRALVAAAGGRLEEALADCERALEQHARFAVPFERARTLLVRGQLARRARKWGLARASLEEAMTAFDGLGAVLWSGRARDELGRIGGRTAHRWELSESERRVAELVAQGRTNKEVAAALFLSPKTVAATLGRVYRKLGISSRTELAARLHRRD